MKNLKLQLCLLAGFCTSTLSAQFSAGDGTADAPFQIQNKEQLAEVANYLSSHFILMNDIDLTNETWNQIGSFDQPFCGVFDGNGHKILGASINSSASLWSGFFGYLNQGTIKNLHLENLSLKGNAIVGGLVGQIDNGGVVKNCIVEGSVTSFDNIAGGIVGCIYNGGGSIINCIADVTVTTGPASLTAGGTIRPGGGTSA
uniref:GLUG motif-containing protein n=1 Tax=Barnesiella viscericola TaxID=397865 RepID=UPI00248EE005